MSYSRHDCVANTVGEVFERFFGLLFRRLPFGDLSLPIVPNIVLESFYQVPTASQEIKLRLICMVQRLFPVPGKILLDSLMARCKVVSNRRVEGEPTQLELISD